VALTGIAVAMMAGGCVTASPEATIPASVEPLASTTPGSSLLAGSLDAGTHILRAEPPGSDPILVTVTVPESWAGLEGWILTGHGGISERTGVSIQFWGAPDFTYTDACHWSTTQFAVEPTVDFMTSALAAQQPRDASPPAEITHGGRRAVEVQLSVPDDIEFSTCDEHDGTSYFQSWHYGSGQEARYHQGPGQRDLVRLVDVDGELVIIDATFWPEVPEATHAEMMAVLDSIELAWPE